MLSDYPRTRQVIVHAMELYHQQRNPEKALENAAELATQETARRVIAAFDEVNKMPPVLPEKLRGAVYQWLALFPGFGLSPAELEEKWRSIVRKKSESVSLEK